MFAQLHLSVSLPGEHHHLVLQVVVHGDPEDGVHVALGAGLPGHAHHALLEEADPARPDWQWTDPRRSA